MCNQNHISNIPLRILYTMLRVADLERSVTFYRDVLGMQELRRENFTAGRFRYAVVFYQNDRIGRQFMFIVYTLTNLI